MRKIVAAVVLVLISGAVVCAQGFITQSEIDARKKEIQDIAARLLSTRDTHKRIEARKEMVDKDVIRGPQGEVRADGFAVPSFQWLYRQGLDQKDLNARLDAIIGLSMLDSSAARDPVVQALDDPSDAVQLVAIQAIEKDSIVRAGKLVVLKLRSPEDEVVAAAAQCLAALNYGGSGESTGPMIELMTQKYQKLQGMELDDPARADCNRMIEVLGRACGQLIPGVTWSPGPSMEDLGKEISKLTQWWNQKYLGDLKDPRPETRKEALAHISLAPDRSVFMPVLDAVVQEFTRLQSSENPAEKQRAQQFIVDASTLLSRISGLDTGLRPTSNAQDIQAAVKRWQAWWQDQMRTMATP